MEQYLGIKGNTHYLINKDNNEAYSFDNFGTSISKCSANSALVELMGKCFEVDILSILGEQGSNKCELYFNGYTAIVNNPYLDVYAKLNKFVKRRNHIIYSIKYPNKVKQILLPLVKDSISCSQISSLFGILNWTLVQS